MPEARPTPIGPDRARSGFGGAIRTAIQKERLGFPSFLLLVYLFMEYARPVNPLKIPMMISIVLFLHWLTVRDKYWHPQVMCFGLFLCVVGVMGPFAANSFAIFWGFIGLGVQLFCICVPTIHIVDSIRKLRWFINVLIVLFVYVAVFALTHGGMGPGGHVSDENDTALALNCMIPFAFLSIFFADTALQKTLYAGAAGIMVAGVIGTMSRGGFLGLLPVLLYCFILSPNKMRSIRIGIVLVAVAALFAPDKYWEEMGTIGGEVQNDDPLAGTGALRRHFWGIAREMFFANPLFGIGLGNFPYVLEDYESEEMLARVGRSVGGNVAHSLYFTILAETGLAGALVYASLVYFNFRDLANLLKSTKWFVKRGADAPASPLGLRQWPRSASPMGQPAWRVPAKAQSESSQALDAPGKRDIEVISYYGHATRAGMIGFLCSGVFLTVLIYPHFWILTSITVILMILAAKKGVLNPTESSNALRAGSSSLVRSR